MARVTSADRFPASAHPDERSRLVPREAISILPLYRDRRVRAIVHPLWKTGVLAIAAVSLLCFAITATPYPAVHHVRRNPAFLVDAKNGAVASENEVCSDLGVRILKLGGNAVDAAVAATFCIGVVNLFSSGIGGGGFMTVRVPPSSNNPSSDVWSIDFRETAPAHANTTMYVGAPEYALFGGLAIGVPGEVRGLAEMHARWGSLPWAQLVQPSVELASGWRVGKELARRLPYFADLIFKDPAWTAIFAPDGKILGEGETVRRTNYSRTLAAIAANGADAFYKGEIADAIVHAVQSTGGIMTHKDLEAYAVNVAPALVGTYRGRKVYTPHAPTSGPVLMHMLNLLERYDLSGEGRTVLNTHRLVEVMKFGFAARTKICDPAFTDDTARIDEISTKTFGKLISANVTDDTTHTPDYYNPVYDVPIDHGTSHISVVDKNGMAVAITSTVNLVFGSQVMDPVTGVLFNDEMDDFSTPGTANAFGLWPSPYNYPEPNKRPLSSTSPTIIEHADGSFYLALGGSGGSKIFPAVLQVLLGIDEWGLDASEAVEWGRLHDQLYPSIVEADSILPQDAIDGLRERGHNVTVADVDRVAAVVQVVMKAGDKIYGKKMKTSGLLSIACLALRSVAYDYVVVGGGAGGLTVASRLSEDPAVSVLVIEAGLNVEDLPEVFIPGLIGSGQSFTTLNWRYPTVPQANLNSRQININAGKALGGSTAINGMIFPRAEKEQYDVWGSLNDDSAWTWDRLLPYFKKSELSTPPNAFQVENGVRFDEHVHGFDGRVHVGFPNFFFNQSRLWVQTAERLGFPASPDLANGSPHAVGVAPNSLNAMNNTRCSAVCAYFTPFASRPNFTVITNATVSRLLWNSSTKNTLAHASGVEYITNNGSTFNVSANKEVIVSAGTIGSPKVLELSGVGNSTILKAAGVQQKVDLPTVGENLAVQITYITGLTKDLLNMNATFASEQLALWFSNRTGLFSAAPRSLGIAAPSDVFSQEQLSSLVAEGRRTLQSFAIAFSNGNADLAKGIAKQLDAAFNLYERNKELPLEMNLEPGYSGPTPLSARPNRTFTTINAVLYAPLSRGRTHINSSSPFAFPAVNPGYYSHPMDIAAHVGGVRLARRMLTAPPLGETFLGEFEPGANKTSDAQIEAWLRANATSDNHETGTCAMMPRALGGVVDTSLLVYGTSNVRVVDASIIPFPISAHIVSDYYFP
ncbi:hypothetical protein EW145_g4025 [Phellinidium pouzarii]|uniref:Glutathione hydrolase n=1 Tax=Phellinidium pouzarii TaxID=167371 RepID=A0A4S4LA42_9AGAM|nr:hypothetical protein EW145_g4025 [Phellinidium pouzarii]